MTRLPCSSALALLLLVGACADPAVAGVMHGDAGTPTPQEDASPRPRRDAGPGAPEPGCSEACEIVDVVAGLTHSCALRASGEVVCWGANDEGQLGDGSLDHGSRCRLGSEVLDCAVTPVEVTNLNDAVRIAAGLKHTCALRTGGEVMCWGWSAHRQLGDGDRHRSETPVLVQGLDR